MTYDLDDYMARIDSGDERLDHFYIWVSEHNEPTLVSNFMDPPNQVSLKVNCKFYLDEIGPSGMSEMYVAPAMGGATRWGPFDTKAYALLGIEFGNRKEFYAAFQDKYVEEKSKALKSILNKSWGTVI